ncbi:MAG: PIN domain-containing protein [Chloroflexia bacterium]
MAVQLGLLDTNIFIHPLYARDPHGPRCQALLDAIEREEAEGWIDVAVVHELTYALRRAPGFADRARIHTYIDKTLAMPRLLADDKDALIAALGRWASEGIGFIDAWLATLADRRGFSICSVNRQDFPVGLENTFVTADLEQEEEGA